MKGIRFYLALYSAKLLSKALVLAHRNGTHNPGVLALKICPDFLARMDKPKTILGVTGTNGKTTSTNMINDILIDNGYHPVSNRYGSNILGGVATTLISAINWRGQTVNDLAVLELDERSSRLIYPYIHPDLLLVTNLFQDSYKRNAHVEFIYDILDQNIPASTKLVLNGDDPISARLASKNDRVYYGVLPLKDEEVMERNLLQDITLCPYCGAPLEYDFRRYHHIGQVHCTRCDFASPDLDYAVSDVSDGRVHMRLRDTDTDFKLVSPAITDTYNLAGVAALLTEFGFTPDQLRASIEKLQIVKSRFTQKTIGDKTIISIVCKGQNPVACSRVFDTVRRYPGNKIVAMMLDDYTDSHESSESLAWLYNTDFEFFSDDSVQQIVYAGVRNQDYLVRFLIAGVPQERITCVPKESQAIDALDLDKADTIFLLYDLYAIPHLKNAQNQLEARLNNKEAATHEN